MDELRELWRQHVADPFPDGCRGTEVHGVDLVMLDADVAGCIDTYLGSSGKLDQQRLAILDRCRAEARSIVPRLSDQAKSYFARLERMAGLIVDEARAH